MKALFNKKSFEIRLAILALLISFLTVVVGNPINTIEYPNWNFGEKDFSGTKIKVISVTELAKWIIDKRDDFLLIDTRDRKQYDKYQIPFAINISDTLRLSLNNKSKIIVYAQNELFPKKIWSMLHDNLNAEMYFLDGGIEEWVDMILFPDLMRLKVKSEDQLEKIKSISLYFGGKPKSPGENRSKRSEKYLREGC